MNIQSILDKNRSRSRGPVYDPIAAVFDRILLGPGLHLTPRFVQDHHVTHIVNCAEKAACPAWASTHVGPSAYFALEAEAALLGDASAAAAAARSRYPVRCV